MISFRCNIDDAEVKTELKGLAGRLAKPRQALKECGLVLLRSVAKNFASGGRPVRWKPSGRARRQGGVTLTDTARLKKSMTMEVTEKRLAVGTNVKYARIHQLGGRIDKNVTVRTHWRRMVQAFGRPIPPRSQMVAAHSRHVRFMVPARPFLMIQDEDWRMFGRIFEDYIIADS